MFKAFVIGVVILGLAGPALANSWCDGAYDPKKGTNFASCKPVDRLAEIQSPDGQAGAADSAGPAL